LQRPALQGGFDYSHASGFYAGNWNSNVSSTLYPNANLEMDFYGGYRRAFGDFGLDAGAIHYSYPGSAPKIDNKEIYVGGSWKGLGVLLGAAYVESNAKDSFYTVSDARKTMHLGRSGLVLSASKTF
jgi:uncharacterized protein (TIGR02001 family)